MISERIFAAKFPSFWKELLPLLTPSFVQIVNTGLKSEVKDRCGVALNPVGLHAEIERPALVAEFAFFLAKAATKSGRSMESAFEDTITRQEALENAYETLDRYEGKGVYESFPLSDLGQEEGLALARVYQTFLSAVNVDHSPVEFSPFIRGSGFIDSCRADLAIGRTLFEIKTVRRNLSGMDIRQLITYLALQSMGGGKRWVEAGFFNPRRAVFYRFDVGTLLARLSGGRAAMEVFRELTDFASRRETQVDSPF